MSRTAAEATTPTTGEAPITQTEKPTEEALSNLELKYQQLQADVEELKNRKFLILFVDQKKIREVLLKNRAQKRKEFSAEAQEKLSNLEFQRDSLIVQLTAENFEQIRQEYSNKEKQIKLFKAEADSKIREMLEEEDELFDQCLRQAISKYYSIHEDEMKDGTALLDINSLITNLQSLEPNANFIARDCTQELTNLAMFYFQILEQAAN